MHQLSSADGNGTTLTVSAVTTGRKLMGRWVYPLSGVISIPASTWTVTYRAMRSASAKDVVAHCDVDILIRMSNGTVRSTVATDVANSPIITLVNAWQTLTGTYDWAAYTVVDQTDYLEVAYYIEVTTPQNSKKVHLLVDDGTLPLVDQTKIENVMFTYPNQAPVASFTFSPSNPVIYEKVTFNASASYDPDGNIVSYEWDFGDGNITTVTDPIITHVYITAESTINYTVNLTVTDNEGSTGSTTQSVPVTNPTILHVSLPAGTYVGPDPDNWLSQCWLLSITGLSGTFTIRINNTHASWASYDTHLIIALNNASYEYFDSLAVDATTIPKTSFIYGTPEPYGFTLTWEEDVYPTWFSDIYVVGIVDPKSYKDVQVSVNFSNTNGVRMHFDAYGSRDSPPPPKGKGCVTHNPHQKDSTVSFYPPPTVPPHAHFTWSPPSPQVCETVTFNATESYDPDGSIVNYTWNFGDGNITWVTDPIITHHYTMNGTYTVNLTVTDNDGLTDFTTATVTVRKHPVAKFTYSPPAPYVNDIVTFDASASTPDGGYIVNYTWNFDDGNITTVDYPVITHVYTASGKYNVTLTIIDSEGKNDTTWDIVEVVEQYYLTVKTDPADIVTIEGEGWYDNCTYANLTAPMFVPNATGVAGERYRFDHWTVDGDVFTTLNITVHMDANHTATAHYVKQYYLTVVSPHGTTGGQGWYDNCTTAYATLNIDIVDHGNGTRRVFTHWSEDATGTDLTSDPIHMDKPKTATANWKTQYYLTVISPYGSPEGEGWYNASDTAYATITPLTVPGLTGVQYVFDGWSGDASGSSSPSDPITMDGPKTAVANWKTQYYLTVISPYGSPEGEGWYNASDTAYATVTPLVVSGPMGVQYVFTGWSDDATGSSSPSDPIIMDGPKTAIANWKTQYYLTVTSPYDSPTPTSGWFDAGTEITASVTSPWPPTPTDTRYVCTGWNGTGSVPPSGTTTTVTFTINAPSSITWTWKTQYLVTFDQTGLDSTAIGTVVTVNGTPKTFGDLPFTMWVDSGSTVTYSYSATVSSSVSGKWFSLVSVTGPYSPITVTGPATVTGNYEAEYEPTPVGGIGTPVTKLELLALYIPWILLASSIISALVATAVFTRRRENK